MHGTETVTDSPATSPRSVVQAELEELAGACLTTALIRGYDGARELDAEFIRAGVHLPMFRELAVEASS